MPINYGSNDVSTSGLITANSGNFSNSLRVNGTGVSISGHNHLISDITNFNISGGYDISVTNNSGIYTIASTNLAHADSQQPQGFVNRTDSRISVSGNIFRIEPTGSSYSYYNKGIKVVKTSGDSLTIPNLTQINYIHFDTINNQISNKTTSFDFSSDIPIAYVAWNSGVGPSGQMTFFAEERHGIVMDTSTHKWIHYTFGAQYVEGLSISNYSTSGNGSSNSDATIAIGNGTLYQEDIEINITDSSSTDPFCQELSPIAQIPVYYHQGNTGQWVKNTATDYPVKYDANGPQYNLLSGGTWTIPNVSPPGGQTRYFAVWILATNQIDDPIISIMGQRIDSNQGSAENNNSWGDVNLTNLPLSEVKPLYRLIFAGDRDYTNVPKCTLLSILDIRVSVINTIAGVTQNDHGNLFGLGDDDHSQYLHLYNARTVNAIHNFANGINLPIGVYDSFIKAPTNPIASVNFYLPNDLGVSDLTFATTSNKISDFASCTSSQLATKISDETGSGRLVFNNSPTLSGIVSVSGNVGIGTGNPTSQLHVIGSGLFSGDVTASGSFIGGSGTALLPSFEFTGDPDTGLFSPAANTFGISTSGVERLRVDSVGRVGIGTASPSSTLQVSGLITANSGNFTQSLQVNGTGVSISGHTHDASSIVGGTLSSDILPSFSSGKVAYVSKRSSATDTRTSLSPYDILKPFSTISAAASSTSEGDVIIIEPGSYDAFSVSSSGLFTGNRSFICRPGVSLSIGLCNFNGSNKSLSILGFPSIFIDNLSGYADGICVLNNYSTLTLELGDMGYSWEGCHAMNISANAVFMHWKGVVSVDGDSSLIKINTGGGSIKYEGFFNCHSLGEIHSNIGPSSFGILPISMAGYFGAHTHGLWTKTGNDPGFLITTSGGGGINLDIQGVLVSELYCEANGSSINVSSTRGSIDTIYHTKGSVNVSNIQSNSIVSIGSGLNVNSSKIDYLVSSNNYIPFGAPASSGNVILGPDVTINNIDPLIGVTQLQSTSDNTVKSYAIQRSNHTGTQLSSTISNFNSSVSGLLPTGTANYITKFGTNGSGLGNSLVFDNGTNVGIGTSSPAATLEINGPLKFTNCDTRIMRLDNSNIAISGGSNNLGHFGLNIDNRATAAGRLYRLASYTDGTNGSFRIRDDSAGADRLIISSNGNVGIGTSTPSGQLHVVGTGLFTNIDINGSVLAGSAALTVNGGILTQGAFVRSSSFSIYGDNTTQIYKPDVSTLGYAVSSTGLKHSFGYNNAGTHTPWAVITSSGVGIGTTTPSGYLDVAGDVYVRGTGNNLGTVYFKSQIVGDKTLYVGATNGGDLVMNGGGASIQLSSQGGSLNALGSSTQIHIGHGYNAGNTTQTIRFLPAATEMMRMTTSGTMGIGLPTSASSYAGNSVQLFSSQPYSNTRVHIAGSGANSSSAALIVTNSGMSPLFYARNDGNIGIGTTTPTSTLHVAGDVLATGSFIGGSGTALLPSFEFINDPDTGLFSPAANTLAISTSGVERLRVDNAGSISMNGPLNVDPYTAGQINCMFVNAGTSLGGSLSTDTLNIYQIIANNIPTTNITLSDSVTISSDPGANITLYDSASISSNDGANITLTDNIGISCGGDVGLNGESIILTCDPSTTIELNGVVNVNGNLTFDSYTESVVANGNSGASKTLSLASGTVHTCTLTNNCTFTMPTATAGKSFSMFLNSGSGNYTASFSGVRWADSAIPTATITASKVDIYSFISDGSFWYGSFSQNYG